MKKRPFVFKVLQSRTKCVSFLFASVCLISFISCSEENDNWDDGDENCTITYVTNDNQVLISHAGTDYGANLIQTHYSNGHGKLIFDAPVTSIGETAFINAVNLVSIYLPEEVTLIGEKAFTNCINLEYVSMENKVTAIETGAFHSCHKLEDIYISTELTLIGERAFASCRDIYNMALGKKVTIIGDLAFEGCKNLISFSCESETPPQCGANIFYGCDPRLKIYVPKGAVTAYKNAEGWKLYADKIVGYQFDIE